LRTSGDAKAACVIDSLNGSALEFLQGSAGPREAGGARKSKLLQREVLVPIRLLHKRPISVGDPVDVQRPPEDLAHQNSGGLMGQGDPQDSGDALPDGIQIGEGRHGHTSRPKQGGEDEGSDHLPADLKSEGRVGSVS